MPEIATLTMNPALDVTTGTDRLLPGHKLRCSAGRQDPGGGGINVARNIAALGGCALAVFPAGGLAGNRVLELLAAEQVPCCPVPISGITRESFTVDEKSTGEQYRFVLPGPTLSPEEQRRCLEQLAAISPRPHWLVVSGSLPPGVPQDFLRIIGHLCRDHGIKLLLDSSGAALTSCDGAEAFLLKPSRRELETAVGRELKTEADEAEAARELVARKFASIILVSLGARGALLVTEDLEERFPAIPVEVCSTVGAGDAMLGAVAFGLFRGMALADAVRLGTAAGAATLMTPGTVLARPGEIERLLGRPVLSPAS